MIKRFTLILLICIASNTAFSQKFSVFMGDKEFDQFNYLKAVEYYEHALKKDSSVVHVQRRLAQSYHKIGDNDNSFKFYELLTNNSSHENSDWILYGDLSRENGKYRLAKKCYQEYLKVDSDKKEIKSLVEQMEMLEKVDLTELKCAINEVDFNSSYSDFAPALYGNKVIFSSGRKSKSFRSDKYGWNGQYFLELFQFTKDTIAEEQIIRFAKGIGSRYHEGVVCFSKDLNQMFFTRSNYFKGKLNRDEKGVNNLKIFIAEKENDNWKIATEFPFNSDKYSVGHPSLSADGNTLYFVSDMPGGIGGTDVYKSLLKNGKWTKPINLGKKINTSENEMFPHVNGNTLFFASNGRAGMGGLDIYVAGLVSDETELTHLGAPVNSEADDFALVMHANSNQGYFSSNRRTGKGDDDIYQFAIAGTNDVEIQILNAETHELIAADEIIVNDKVDSSLDFNSETFSYTKEITREENYDLHISREGFVSKDTSFYSDLFDAKQKHVYYLTPIPVVEEIVDALPESLPPIYFDYDKHDITSEANEILIDLFELLSKHEDMAVTVMANTDVRGSNRYNKRLAKNRAKSARKVLLKLGVSADRIDMGVVGEEKPLDKVDSQTEEEWHKFNRRVDFKLKSIEK